MPEHHLDIAMAVQPTDTSCGPTCLHAIYRYHQDPIGLDQVIAETPSLVEGGTLAVMLAIHALRRGYKARIYTYNLQLFDPSWFLSSADLASKLRQQAHFKSDDSKLVVATEAYLEYLELGGKILFKDMSPSLIRHFLRRHKPILTGLSATYLYRHVREIPETCNDDDLRGTPSGHFVVLAGYRSGEKTVQVADPYQANPLGMGSYYKVPISRLVGAILLGVLTYDANLLILDPPKKEEN